MIDKSGVKKIDGVFAKRIKNSVAFWTHFTKPVKACRLSRDGLRQKEIAKSGCKEESE